jgi:hypothetical protein
MRIELMSEVIVQYGKLMLTNKTAINFAKDGQFYQIELEKADRNEFPESILNESQVEELIRVLKGESHAG